jgi:hypothetical protein
VKRVAVSALFVAAALAGVAHCGGTTGQGGDSPTNIVAIDGGDATVSADAAGLDAGADQSLYTNQFDVAIDFADQELPDIQAPPEGGSAGGPGGPPNCPPYILLDTDGGPVPFGYPGTVFDEVPSEYSGDGGIDFAPDGSVCATYPWLGSAAVDHCVVGAPGKVGSAAKTGGPYVILPPCNWALGAGTAVKGPMAGAQRYDLCMDMYECFVRTHCYLERDNFAHNCFCGIPDTDPNFGDECLASPQGQCLQEILAASEDNNDARGINDAFSNWQDTSNTGPGFEARFLEDLFSDIPGGCEPYACAAIGAGDAGDGGGCP